MFIIVGLGNPSKEYEGTRHNAGFEVIDRIADKYNISVDKKTPCTDWKRNHRRSESNPCETTDFYES